MPESNFTVDLKNSYAINLHETVTGYMIAKEETQKTLEALVEQKTSEKQRLDEQLRVLVQMLRELDEEPKVVVPQESEEQLEKQAKQIYETIEFRGKNLSKIVKNVMRLIAPGKEFDKGVIGDRIVTARPDLYHRVKMSSFDPIVWKVATELEAEGEIEAVRNSGRSGNTYRRVVGRSNGKKD